MNPNVCPGYTYFIINRDSRIELIFFTDRLYFERKYTNIFSWPKSCSDAVLITDELHVKH